jgi:hypothetical protein
MGSSQVRSHKHIYIYIYDIQLIDMRDNKNQ